jgi:hypothetical protein
MEEKQLQLALKEGKWDEWSKPDKRGTYVACFYNIVRGWAAVSSNLYAKDLVDYMFIDEPTRFGWSMFKKINKIVTTDYHRVNLTDKDGEVPVYFMRQFPERSDLFSSETLRRLEVNRPVFERVLETFLKNVTQKGRPTKPKHILRAARDLLKDSRALFTGDGWSLDHVEVTHYVHKITKTLPKENRFYETFVHVDDIRSSAGEETPVAVEMESTKDRKANNPLFNATPNKTDKPEPSYAVRKKRERHADPETGVYTFPDDSTYTYLRAYVGADGMFDLNEVININFNGTTPCRQIVADEELRVGFCRAVYSIALKYIINSGIPYKKREVTKTTPTSNTPTRGSTRITCPMCSMWRSVTCIRGAESFTPTR